MNYDEAKRWCSGKNAYLIEIHTPQQMEFIKLKLRTLASAQSGWGLWWGGGSKKTEGEDSCWVWGNSGKLVQDFVWDNGQPNQDGPFFCFDSGDPGYNGVACRKDSTFRPICQKK